MPAPESGGVQVPPGSGVPVKELNNCAVVTIPPPHMVRNPLLPAFFGVIRLIVTSNLDVLSQGTSTVVPKYFCPSTRIVLASKGNTSSIVKYQLLIPEAIRLFRVGGFKGSLQKNCKASPEGTGTTPTSALTLYL